MKNGEAIDLCELIERFGNDQKCRNYLEKLRWPEQVTCPKCQGTRISSILKRDQYNCDNESCGYQFSVTAGTIFHDTHLPLTKWFAHRIRHAVEQATSPKLDGVCEVDETYVGGKKIGQGVYAGKHAKEVVIGIRERKGPLRFFHAEDAKAGTLAKYIRENISGTVSVIVTDDASAYPYAMKKAEMPEGKHVSVNHSAKEYVRGEFHTNSVESAFSLLKRGIMGTWHKVSAKHLAAYLDEMTWRFDNRKNPYLFRDTMLKLIHSENLEYRELIAVA